MQQSPPHATDDRVIEQAIESAKRSSWIVVPEDCHVQIAASRAMMETGTPDAWYVFMFAQPYANSRLQSAMPLGCRVELLSGRLCAVNFYEPSDRQLYLKRRR